MAKLKNIATLRKELAATEKMLGKLKTQRKKLAGQLEALDKKIALLSGGTTKASTKGKVVKKAAKKKIKKTKKVKKAPRKPLVEYIVKVLGASKAGVRAVDVAKKVVKIGYHTKSKDFYTTVAATLAADKRFVRVSRGVYKLA